MRGQAEALGEGTPADAAAARRDYAAACARGARVPACSFATRALARLDQAPAAPTVERGSR